MSDNPYAAPYSPVAIPAENKLAVGTNTGIWRDGKFLVVHKSSVLPPVCVKTNEAADRSIERKFYWHSSFLYLLILLHILIYAIVALMVRKKHVLSVPISADYAAKRGRNIAIGWLVGLIGVACFVGAICLAASVDRLDDTTAGIWVGGMLFGFLLLLAGVLIGSRASSILTPKKMTESATWFKGADPAYLQKLPIVPPIA